MVPDLVSRDAVLLIQQWRQLTDMLFAAATWHGTASDHKYNTSQNAMSKTECSLQSIRACNLRDNQVNEEIHTHNSLKTITSH